MGSRLTLGIVKCSVIAMAYSDGRDASRNQVICLSEARPGCSRSKLSIGLSGFRILKMFVAGKHIFDSWPIRSKVECLARIDLNGMIALFQLCVAQDDRRQARLDRQAPRHLNGNSDARRQPLGHNDDEHLVIIIARAGARSGGPPPTTAQTNQGSEQPCLGWHDVGND